MVGRKGRVMEFKVGEVIQGLPRDGRQEDSG